MSDSIWTFLTQQLPALVVGGMFTFFICWTFEKRRPQP
jgi:hypothetical protein